MLRALIVQDGWPLAAMPDMRAFQYLLPTERFITGPFAEHFQRYLEERGIEFVGDAFNCNRFSLLAAAMMNEANYQTQIGRALGLPEGETAGIGFGAVQMLTRRHSVNVAAHLDDHGRFYTWCYEPQPSLPDFAFGKVCFRAYTVTPEDKRSASSIQV